MNESELIREQAWWEEKHANAMQAVHYADRQLDRIANKLAEVRYGSEARLSIVRDHVQLVLLHGGECD